MLEQLCRDIYETVSYENLTIEEQERLTVLMIHDVAMAVQSADLIFTRTLIDEELLLADGQLSDGYSLWGRLEKSRSFDMAAQHNAMAITASIREDFVIGTHPGAVIFPLVIAQAERQDLSMEAILSAAAVGLKTSLLLLEVFNKAVAKAGYRPTTAINTIAGAAALAKAQGKRADEAIRAMSAASGMMQGYTFHFQEGTEEWLVQVPLVVSAATLACKNAGALHFSHPTFLSGERSLGTLLGVRTTDFMGNSGLAGFHLSLMRLGVKRHPVNSFVQPVVEAVVRLLAQCPKDVSERHVSEINEILVAVPEGFRVVSETFLNPGPLTSPNLGILSLPVSVALTLIHKRLRFEDFRGANDAHVVELAKRVRVEFSAELTGYDVRVEFSVAGKVQQSACPTTFFYPSLAEELAWVKEQISDQNVLWINRLSDQAR